MYVWNKSGYVIVGKAGKDLTDLAIISCPDLKN